MNYYKRHIGDYAKKAGHLSVLEHGVYTLLLDSYYDREQAPTREEAVRVSRCRTDAELAALDAVLADFFTLTDGRYVQARVEEEFVKAEAQAIANQANGKRGGRPRKPKGNRTETHSVPSGKRNDSEKNPNPLIHQSTNPTTEKQETVRSPNGSRLPPDWTLPDEWRQWAEQERRDVDALMESRVFADYWASQPGAKGRKTDWQATWRNWIRRAQGRSRAGPQQQQLGKQAQGLMALEAMKSGNRMAAGRDTGGASEALLLGPGSHSSGRDPAGYG